MATIPVRIPTTAPTVAPVLTQEPQPQRTPHYVVLIVLDAGRVSYLDLGQFPHIKALMDHGVVYDQAYVGELESSTPGVHVTFGTGTLPRENGFMGFGWAAPQTRARVDFRALLANGQIDPVLRNLPLPSVAARLHQYFPNAVSIAGSGHKDYAVVGLGGGASTYELYGKFTKTGFAPAFMHDPPPLSKGELQNLTVDGKLKVGDEDLWAFRYASQVASHTRPRLLMLNVPEVDTWGHWYGPDDSKVFRSLMRGVDHGIGLIENTYRKLGILDQTDFIITADHSMMESRPARSWQQLWVAARQVGDGVVRADGEGGAVWLKDPAKAQAVAQALVARNPAHVMAIFYRSNLGLEYHFTMASPQSWLVGPQEANALQDLVDTTAGRDGPDLWVLYRENYTVVSRNVSGQWKGTHGGATWKVQHVPLIISGADIRQGVHSQFPARAIDIAPTMERLLGLPPIKRDGVILADALLDPSQAEVQAQGQVTPDVTADAQALQQQSAADDASEPPLPASSPPTSNCTTNSDPATACSITASTDTNE